MTDYSELVKRLRYAGDRAAFEPHMHHEAADAIEALQREVLAAEARGLDRAAKLCSETRDEALEASGIEGRVIASWFSAQAEAIRAQATALRKALEQEQGNG